MGGGDQEKKASCGFIGERMAMPLGVKEGRARRGERNVENNGKGGGQRWGRGLLYIRHMIYLYIYVALALAASGQNSQNVMPHVRPPSDERSVAMIRHPGVPAFFDPGYTFPSPSLTSQLRV